MDIFKELQEEGVDAALLEEIQRFRQAHPAPRAAGERHRLHKPVAFFYALPRVHETV